MKIDFAGLFFERDVVYISIIESHKLSDGIAASIGPIIPETKIKGITRLPIDYKYPEDAIRDSVRTVICNTSNLGGLGIASFGPFRSLDRRDDHYGETEIENEYGVISNNADLPLRGKDLYSLVRRALKEFSTSDADVPVMVHTDATAGAIAEAYYRGNITSDTLVYLFLTYGVGGGYVIGNRPVSSKHHAEMGLIHVRYHPNDSLDWVKDRIKQADSETQMGSSLDADRLRKGDIGSVANLHSIQRRFEITRDIHLYGHLDDFVSDHNYIDPIAYYFSQMCMAVTSILAPKLIVLGGRIPRSELFVDLVKDHFMGLRDKRPGMYYPKEEDVDRFIVPSLLIGKSLEYGDWVAESHYFGAAYLGAIARHEVLRAASVVSVRKR